MSGDDIAVFFYGLFMDESMLASKGISPSKSTIGYVNGYGLRIGKRATLVPDQTNRAYGVLMTIRTEDVTALYSEESVSDYVSETVSVVLPDGTLESAVCYNLLQPREERRNSDYANSLLQLAGKLGFPDDYLEQIRSVASQS
jgi:hypothetical protein